MNYPHNRLNIIYNNHSLFLSNDKGCGINMKEMGASIQIQLNAFLRIGNLLIGVYR